MFMFISIVLERVRASTRRATRKPTTAELEPQGTSVYTWSECRRARPEQCNMIWLPNISVGLPGARFEIHNEILLKDIML